jgi:hypothetical protein
MISLGDTYKLSLAKECTELAIQHGLIREQEDAESTAKSVTEFFQSIFDNLDSNAK